MANINRREWIAAALSAAVPLAGAGGLLAENGGGNIGDLKNKNSSDKTEAMSNIEKQANLKGNIHQAVSRWCYSSIPFPEFCDTCRQMGIVGIDLVMPDDWKMVIDHGLAVSMGSLPEVNITEGINREENHDRIVACYEKYIPIAAELGITNVISLSGNRGGLDDESGIAACAKAMKRVMPTAEKYGVTVHMELLNEYDHTDYQCSHTSWGAEVCRRVGSPRFKLLYDIYHMQRSEGEIIGTIRKYADFIGHYHTGGNPGRNDIDQTQELYYPAIMRAILETGYTGFVAHEFMPRDGLNSLRRAVEICDV